MELYCIDCKKNIKKDSKEHDNCILINDGEDLVCEDCGYTDDEYEWECQCGCGKEVPFTRSYTEDKVIQVEEQEYWLKECAIQKLGISEDICIECYQRPCNCGDSEDEEECLYDISEEEKQKRKLKKYFFQLLTPEEFEEYVNDTENDMIESSG